MKILFFILIIFIFCDEEFPLQKDVIILTNSNFYKAIKKYEYLLVLFYTPYCDKCQTFYNEYEKASYILRKEYLYLSKIDGTIETNITKNYNIQGFPSIKLFKKGEISDYTGGSKSFEIINWMRKRTNGTVINSLNSLNDFKIFQKDNEIVLIYFGSNKSDIEEITKVARKYEDIPFGLVTSDSLIKQLSEKGNIVLYKKADSKKIVLKDIKEESLEKLINNDIYPKIMKFDEKAAKLIFGKSIPSIILFPERKRNKLAQYENILRNVSNKINDKYKIAVADIREKISEKLIKIIGLRENNLPSVIIIDPRNEFKKYKLEGNIDEQNILKFIKNWENGKLKPFLKSEIEPRKNNGVVFKLVGDTFKKEVINNDKDVMVLFSSNTCSHCKTFYPKYEELAKKLKKMNPKLILSIIDGKENEIEFVNIEVFPSIKFYPGNKKDKPPIDYDGDGSLDDMIKFIKNNAATPVILDNDKKDKTVEL